VAPETVTEQVFAVQGAVMVDISNICGRINVRGSDRSDVTIRARKDTNGHEAVATATVIEMGQDGDRVWAKTQFRQGVGALYGLLENNGRPVDVFYDVECPRKATVSVNGLSCSLNVANIDGDVKTNAMSGRSEVSHVHGDLSMNSVSGALSATGATGRIRARSVSGRIDATDCHASEFRINTVSGAMRLDTRTLPEHGTSITTVSGRCELAIPRSSACTIVSHSVSGSVHCDLPANVLESKRSRWRATLNGGGTEITFNSVSGGLTVRPSSPSTATHNAQIAEATETPGPAPASARDMPPTSIDMVEPARPAEPVAPMPPMRPMAPMEPMRPMEPMAPMAPMRPMTPREPMTSASSQGATVSADVPGEKGSPESSGDDMLQILKAIERGDISVDEGLARLDAMEVTTVKGGTHDA